MKENCNCCCYQYWFHLHVSITQTRIWVHLFHEEELVCRKRMKFTELWWIFYILGEEVFYLKGTFISSKCTALYLTASATDNERIRRNEKRRLKRCQNGNENYFTINVKLDNIAISQLDNSLKSNTCSESMADACSALILIKTLISTFLMIQCKFSSHNIDFYHFLAFRTHYWIIH